MSRTWFTGLLSAVVLLTGLSACGTPEPMTDTELYAALPLEQFRLRGEREHTIRRAEDQLVRACMKARGVAWNPPPISERDTTPEFRRYGVLHPEVAQKFGYRVPVDPVRERRNHYFLAEIDTRQAEALARCVSEVNNRLGEYAPATKGMLVSRLGQKSLRLSRKVEAVETVRRDWSACMKAAGYRYPDPDAAAEDPRWRTPEPTKREIAVAVADAGCKQAVRLPELWSAAEAEIQRRLIPEHAEPLDAIKGAHDRTVARAVRALG